ncbi:hypothetical protein MAUB1S_04210 [Mycolicibacterium aubagnense]
MAEAGQVSTDCRDRNGPRSGRDHRHWVPQTPRTAQPTERRLAGTESDVARSVDCLGVLARVAVAPGGLRLLHLAGLLAVAVQRCAVPASARPMAVPRFERSIVVGRLRSVGRLQLLRVVGSLLIAALGRPGSPERPSCRWICHCPDREPVGAAVVPVRWAAGHIRRLHRERRPITGTTPGTRHQSVQWELVAQWRRAAPRPTPPVLSRSITRTTPATRTDVTASTAVDRLSPAHNRNSCFKPLTPPRIAN